MRTTALFTATCVLLLAAGQATAEDKKMNESLDLVSGPPQQCLSLLRIERSEVVDDRNILFHMGNGDIYRNQLPYRCTGLSLHDTFMYRTSLNQLCHMDIITVMQSIGFGLSPGASCGLGHFYPVTEEQAEKLREMAGS
ncbi:DUF6491 family protein [Lentisalinibacter sediminis]|uniref:DUF6491 family protein n=1 Tax=Lentisalinibacter sediminis TaxID=2992237 RepID=UPI003870B721